jgi:hypothetical protein
LAEKLIPLERAYSFAQSLIRAIPAGERASAAEAALDGQVHPAVSDVEALRRHLADQILLGEPTIRFAVERISQDAYRDELQRALNSVLHRMRQSTRNA